jgi:hypothetical protein
VNGNGSIHRRLENLERNGFAPQTQRRWCIAEDLDRFHDFLFQKGAAPESDLTPQEGAELDKLCDEAMECWEDLPSRKE